MASSSTGMPHSQVDDSRLFHNYSMNGRIIIATLGLLFFIIVIIIVLHMYSKLCWRRSITRQRSLSRLRITISSYQETNSKASGLDKETVEALPVFIYAPQLVKLGANAGAIKAAECAVCLADFRQDESCKLLPKCKHFFHTACIEKWFLMQATCPLCRATLGSFLVDEEVAAESHSTTHVDGGLGDQG